MRTFAIIIITAMLALCGCRSTKYVPVETVRTELIEADTAQFMAIINALREQISQKESRTELLIHKETEKETVKLNDKGDTIGRDRKREVYIHLSEKEQKEYERTIEAKNDTIRELRQQLMSVKADSVKVPYPVEKELTRWQQAKMDFGGMAIGAVIVGLCIAVWWLIKKFR